MALAIRLANATPDPSRPKAVRDQLEVGANNGLLFLHDVRHAYSGLAAAPANGQVIRNLVMGGADGVYRKTMAEAVTLAGGGLDTSNWGSGYAAVEIPASVAASISAQQKFAVMLYVRLPSLADWSTGAGVLPYLCFTSTQGGYLQPEIDMVTVGAYYAGGLPRLTARRQKNGGATVDLLNVEVPAGGHSSLAQIVFKRDAAGQTLRVRTSGGVLSHTLADGGDNSANFGAKPGFFGIPESIWNPANGAHLTASNMRFCRVAIENLALSGRAFLDVADADWTRNAPALLTLP